MLTARLDGKRVMVTGAGRGIGADTARELAARGARVALVGRSAGNLEEVAAAIGPAAAVFTADISDAARMAAVTAEVVAAFGGLDAVVANAGIAAYGTIATVDPAAFERVLTVNLVGSYTTAHATLPALAASGGYFLSVSSVAAFAPAAAFASYGASKAGLEAMVDAFALEAAPLGVAVGSAHPSWIDTDMLRDSDADLPAFAAGRQLLPWPCNTTTDAATCARTLADMVAHRSRRAYLPRAVAIVRWGRAILTGRIAFALAGRKVDRIIPELEAQHRALGRSVSERAAGQVGAARAGGAGGGGTGGGRG